MTTTDLEIFRLQELADELTMVAPPPKEPLGVNQNLKNGKWVVEKVGAGMYAIRAEYRSGENVVVIKVENEVRGFASALTTALSFAIQVASSSRHYWLPA